MRLVPLAAALLLALPAVAQTPLTGTSGQPTTQTPPLAGSSAGPALPSTPAQPSAPATRTRRARVPLAQRFEAANTTHDGHLTQDQARTGNMRGIARDFASIDKDHKGYVTMDDIRASARARRAARRAAPQ